MFDDVAADTDPIPYGWSASPDTTPPSAPVLTLSESGPNEHAAGTTLYYNPAFGNSRRLHGRGGDQLTPTRGSPASSSRKSSAPTPT